MVVVLELVLLAGVLLAVLFRLHEGERGLPETPGAAASGARDASEGLDEPPVPPPPGEHEPDRPSTGAEPEGAVDDVPPAPAASGTEAPTANDGPGDVRSGPPAATGLPASELPEGELRADVAAVLAALRVRIELIKTETGYYPASHGRSDDAFRGIEALYAALPREQRSRCPSADLDGDGRPELVDPWGRPYAYWRADDYEHAQVTEGGAQLAPRRLPAPARGYVSSHRFQLFSLGPDPDSPDDDVVR